MELSKIDEDVQVTLLTVFGAEAQEVYTTFTWTDPANAQKVDPVFKEYCEPKEERAVRAILFQHKAATAWGNVWLIQDIAEEACRRLCFFKHQARRKIDENLRDRLVLGSRTTRSERDYSASQTSP